MPRQTPLTLTELIQHVDANIPRRCLYVNEIGEVYRAPASSEEKDLAGKKLAALLDDGSLAVQFASLMFLSIVPTEDTLIREAIAKFRTEPRNAEVVKDADERIQSMS